MKRLFRLRRFRNSTGAGALALLLCLALAGVSRFDVAAGQEAPESILPQGFGEPPQPPAPSPTRRPAAPSPVTPPGVTPGALPSAAAPSANPLPGDDAAAADESIASDEAAAVKPVDPAVLAEYELPSFARRSTALVGVVGQDQGGFGANAFGQADGLYLEALMRRLNAPVASRWVSIGLRQALASVVATPGRVGGADFAAERAWLLVRMGESVVARALIAAVDNDQYTPKLLQVAMQTGLANGDPAALCPIVDQGRAALSEPAWVLTKAICAGLSGEPRAAGPLIDAARRQRVARGIDLLLAEKAVGAGSKGRRAVTIEWDGVDRLTIWRYGLATATAAEIPPDLFATAAPQARYWFAQSPVWSAQARVAAAERAAAQGVFSSAALVGLYAEVLQEDDAAAAEAGIAQDLRTASADPSLPARMSALRQLWDEPRDARGRYARLILTARAAAMVPPAPKNEDVDRLIAAMLSAGLDQPAQRWRSFAARGSDAWAMLTLADRNDAVRLSRGDVAAYAPPVSGTGPGKAQMFFAGLAGLGRLDIGTMEQLAQAMGVRIGAENSWTRALDRAVAQRAQGTVMLLAATGMQTGDWHGVSPEALFRIISAMRRVGLTGQARMVAVEALTRL